MQKEKISNTRQGLLHMVFEQVEGEDFYETFTYVVCWSTICTTISLATQKSII